MKLLSESTVACSVCLIISIPSAYGKDTKIKAMTEVGQSLWLPQTILRGAHYVSYLPRQKRLIIIESGAAFRLKSYNQHGLIQSEIIAPDFSPWGSPFLVNSRLFIQLRKRGSDPQFYEIDDGLSRLTTVERQLELRIVSQIHNSNQDLRESIRDWSIDLPWEGIDYDAGIAGSKPTGEVVLGGYPLLLGSPNHPRISYQESPKIPVLLSEDVLIGYKTNDKWKTLRFLDRDPKLSAAFKGGTVLPISTIIAKNRVKIGCLFSSSKSKSLTIIAEFYSNGKLRRLQKTTYLAVQNVLTLK